LILIDARAAARPELGGVERWARETATGLPERSPDRYVAVRPPRALAHRAGHAWEQTVLPALAVRRGARLILCPANLAPVASRRTAVVIHDAAALRGPSWYSAAFVAWQRAVMPVIARRARLVVTVSEFSRAEIAELLGVEATVVPGGVDARFNARADPEPAKAALGLKRPYVLTVASRTARKNLAVLDAAAARLAPHGIDVVAAGGDRPQFRAEGGRDALRELGHVPDEHLPGLYAGAEAFVLPSLYEGFGLTVLEAMASGTPVVAADRAALPETCGGAALLVDPTDPTSVADAIDRALGDPAPLRAAGLQQAARFSWDRTMDELDAALRGCLVTTGVA